MGKLVECIPNFSVSKETNEAVYQGLVDVAKSIPGCMLFDVQSDGNHNRCVFTMVGSPEAIEAYVRAATAAMSQEKQIEMAALLLERVRKEVIS